MKVQWTVPAARQLREIFNYVAEGNLDAAARLTRLIRNVVEQTGRMPLSGRIGRVDGTREVVVPGTSYLVAYRLVGQTVQVLAVLHGAQRWPASF